MGFVDIDLPGRECLQGIHGHRRGRWSVAIQSDTVAP